MVFLVCKRFIIIDNFLFQRKMAADTFPKCMISNRTFDYFLDTDGSITFGSAFHLFKRIISLNQMHISRDKGRLDLNGEKDTILLFSSRLL